MESIKIEWWLIVLIQLEYSVYLWRANGLKCHHKNIDYPHYIVYIGL